VSLSNQNATQEGHHVNMQSHVSFTTCRCKAVLCNLFMKQHWKKGQRPQ